MDGEDQPYLEPDLGTSRCGHIPAFLLALVEA